jgi:ribosomal-protein-alanine N-acetyltransferase
MTSEDRAVNIPVNEHVHLSEFRASDEKNVVQHLQEKEIYDRTLRIPYPYTAADFQAWLGIVATTTRQIGQPVHWAIRNQDGELIGGCGLDGVSIGQSHRAEIGYWLAKPYWGRGIMTAVVGVLRNEAVSRFGLVRLTAHVFSDNLASARVLEKCGFVQEGYLRKHYLKDGKFLDARLFGWVKE